MIPILEAKDLRIDRFRDVRDKDHHRDGHFILEGEKLLRIAVGDTSRFELESILVAESRVSPMSDLLNKARASGVPIYVAPQPILNEIVGFEIHRGVLALGKRWERTAREVVEAAAASHAPILGVLVGIANHDNVGGIFRNAAAFGVDAILIDETTCDPLYRKALRVSVGATLTVPYASVAAQEVVPLLQHYSFEPFALTPRADIDIHSTHRPAKSALFFGSEGCGLPEFLLSVCHPLKIAMAKDWDSLNVATTSGIVFCEWARQPDR